MVLEQNMTQRPPEHQKELRNKFQWAENKSQEITAKVIYCISDTERMCEP